MTIDHVACASARVMDVCTQRSRRACAHSTSRSRSCSRSDCRRARCRTLVCVSPSAWVCVRVSAVLCVGARVFRCVLEWVCGGLGLCVRVRVRLSCGGCIVPAVVRVTSLDDVAGPRGAQVQAYIEAQELYAVRLVASVQTVGARTAMRDVSVCVACVAVGTRACVSGSVESLRSDARACYTGPCPHRRACVYVRAALRRHCSGAGARGEDCGPACRGGGGGGCGIGVPGASRRGGCGTGGRDADGQGACVRACGVFVCCWQSACVVAAETASFVRCSKAWMCVCTYVFCGVVFL